MPDHLPEVPEGALMHLHLDHNQVVALFALFVGELLKAFFLLIHLEATDKRADFIGVCNCRRM